MAGPCSVARNKAREFPAWCTHNADGACEKAEGRVGAIMEMDLPSNKARNSGVSRGGLKCRHRQSLGGGGAARGGERAGWWLAMGIRVFLPSELPSNLLT